MNEWGREGRKGGHRERAAERNSAGQNQWTNKTSNPSLFRAWQLPFSRTIHNSFENDSVSIDHSQTNSDVTFPMKSEDDRSRNSFARRANRMCRWRDCLREEWADDFSSLFSSSHNNDRLKRRNQNDSPITIKGDCYCYDDDTDTLERSQRNELTSDHQQEFIVKFSMEWK